MNLTERQTDALTELINIAFARTAASLSDLTGDRVEIEVPQVRVTPIENLPVALADFAKDEVASVLQPFSGPVAGDALLVLSYDGAVRLADLLADEPTASSRLNESAREVLAEVGNILLNACLGVFGNLLRLHVTFAVPRLYVERLSVLIATLVGPQPDSRYALVVHTGFKLRNEQVSGYLVMVLGVESIERLVDAVDAWEAGDGE
jgi:chemotaxis protein CheC